MSADVQSIHVYRAGDSFRLVVDGEEFPYPVSALKTEVEHKRWPSITVTIPARVVEITNMLDGPSDER